MFKSSSVTSASFLLSASLVIVLQSIYLQQQCKGTVYNHFLPFVLFQIFTVSLKWWHLIQLCHSQIYGTSTVSPPTCSAMLSVYPPVFLFYFSFCYSAHLFPLGYSGLEALGYFRWTQLSPGEMKKRSLFSGSKRIMTWWTGCALRPYCDVQIYTGL